MINNKVTLLDVSFWQDSDYTPYKLDFSIMKSNGGDGVILRAGQNVWTDEDYVDYAKSADAAELPRGAYWFYDSRVSPIPQADVFADLIEATGFPSLGLWGDYEERYGGAWGGEANFLTFMKKLKDRFPNVDNKLIGIYTGPSYWVEKTTANFRNNFASYPLWLAQYKVDKPNVPQPWSDFLIWQYTDEGDGVKFGAESQEIDMDLFNGTLEEYKAYFSIPNYTPVEPQEEGEVGMYKVWSDSYKMSLRNNNSISGGLIEYVPIRTDMIADRIEGPSSGGLGGDKWAHITSIEGTPKDGWVAIIHNGAKYCSFEEIVIPGSAAFTLKVDGFKLFTGELEKE